MQVAGDGAEGVLLHGDQLLRQFAAPRRERRHFLEQAAIVLHQVQAGEQNQHQHGRHEQVDVALHPAYTPRMRAPACCSVSLFCTSSRDTAVLSASWRACSERRISVRASVSWPLCASAKMRSSASQNWRSESLRYLRCSASRSSGEDWLRARWRLPGPCASGGIALPRGERIRLAAVQHVAHGQAERIQVVLNAQQEQRIGAIAVDDAALQLLQSAELHDGVARIEGHRGQRDGKPRQQTDCRRSGLGHSFFRSEAYHGWREAVIRRFRMTPTSIRPALRRRSRTRSCEPASARY